jgi:ribosomal protein L37AE/L43A
MERLESIAPMKIATTTGLIMRERRDCPSCDGTVIEPKSSDEWHCVQCARNFEEDEL